MTRAAAVAENNSGNAVENAWSKLKDPLLCAATAVCGLSKNHQWRPETWWWNDRVEDAVKEKRIRYKAYNALILLLVCVSFTIIGQPRNSVLIRRV